MSSISVFCCLKGCFDGFKFNPTVQHLPKENPIQLDTAYMGKFLKTIDIRFEIFNTHFQDMR